MIDIWRFPLDDKSVLSQTAVLSKDEVDRSDRFVFTRDKERYLAGRILLRTALATYIGLAPDKIAIKHGNSGKPFIDAKVQFNCSHSQEIFVIAVSDHKGIGIDIESIRPLDDIEGLMRQVFSEKEKEFIRTQSQSMQKQVFFQLWTRKEAVLKALGKGIDSSITQFSVLSSTARMWLSLSKEICGELPTRWLITDVVGISDHYACALCVDDEENSQTMFDTNIVHRNW